MREFEFPYNFDKQLIDILYLLDPQGKTINCIYLPPFLKDYQTILRSGEQAQFLNNLSRKEYEEHINYINKLYPGKIQLLLQKDNIYLNTEQIKYYSNLGITKFCVGSLKQAKLIRSICPNSNIIGSISLNINRKKILAEYSEFKKYFDGFVLPFIFSRNLNEIKNLPNDFYYILLINSYCNISCTGKQHWNFDYKINKPIACPGILNNSLESISWDKSARIRPMDLAFFDPYITIYKLQDRGWPTAEIVRDYILYTTDYDIYPNIIYTEELYNGK